MGRHTPRRQAQRTRYHSASHPDTKHSSCLFLMVPRQLQHPRLRASIAAVPGQHQGGQCTTAARSLVSVRTPSHAHTARTGPTKQHQEAEAPRFQQCKANAAHKCAATSQKIQAIQFTRNGCPAEGGLLRDRLPQRRITLATHQL